MRKRFSGSDVPFRAPNKKKEMKMEYRLLHDIVAKALCAKASSFDMVTSEKFDLMVAITAGLKVKWAQVLFQVLVTMVNNPNRQSQGFVVQVGKKQKVVVQQLVEARSQAAPAKSTSETSSDVDSRPLVGIKKRRGAKRKQVIESSDSEATVSVPPVFITKKHQTKRTKKVTHTADHHMESKPGHIPKIPAGEERVECENQTEQEDQDGNVSTMAQEEHVESTAEDETEAGNLETFMESRHESAQPAQQSTTYT
ncbi:hypothetical protein F511_06797 [Dorcoceras hygrometricum]|uniref:Uncharacterized protein n=1 Tax=Dorcoceras hygrometricum TaxID=472368 RepID=A0A2Z7CKQ4_9LAMI|nr:hypothetical protein F511_06797 [Dorcoceras hygrometricum]